MPRDTIAVDAWRANLHDEVLLIVDNLVGRTWDDLARGQHPKSPRDDAERGHLNYSEQGDTVLVHGTLHDIDLRIEYALGLDQFGDERLFLVEGRLTYDIRSGSRRVAEVLAKLGQRLTRRLPPDLACHVMAAAYADTWWNMVTEENDLRIGAIVGTLAPASGRKRNEDPLPYFAFGREITYDNGAMARLDFVFPRKFSEAF